MKRMIVNLIELMLEFLFPTTCVMCGNLCKEGICKQCMEAYPVIHEPRCKCCGKPLAQVEMEYCVDCMLHPKIFQEGRSLWVHKGAVKESIYRFKYNNHRVYAKIYSKLWIHEYGDFIERWHPDCIVPIPIHRHRRRSRGYNQAEVLARALQKQIPYDIPIKSKWLYRKKETEFQKKYDQIQRKRNIKNAFGVRQKTVDYKTVLLVDDIYTTGATLQEASALLRNCGVTNVIFMSISIGQGF